MKPLLLNRNSWHFRLATVYGSTYADYPREDICSYSGAVLKGFSRVLLFTLLVSIGVSVLYSNLLAWIIICIKLRTFVPMMEIAAISITLHITLIALGLATRLYKILWGSVIKTARKPEPKPTFLSKAYKSWKDKTCVPIDFK